MIRNTNGARLESKTLLPHVRTERFPEGYGELWLPEKPIEDVTQWTKRNIDEIFHAAKKSGCIKVKAKLQTEGYVPPFDEITWENLDWFEGTYDLTEIPHWDWSIDDPVQIVALGQRDGEAPRKNPTCNSPTEIVGNALSAVIKTAQKTCEKFPEFFDAMLGVLPWMRSPEKRVIVLSSCFETVRNNFDEASYAAIMKLLQKTFHSIREETVVQDWHGDPGTVLYMYTGADPGTQFSPVAHWAMSYQSEIPKDNLWRARLYSR